MFRCILVIFLMAAVFTGFAEEGESVNLLSNPSFEQPAENEAGQPSGWDWFSSEKHLMTHEQGLGRTGDFGLRMATQGKLDAYLGIIQRRPVSVEKTYTFSAYLRRDKKSPLGGSAVGQLVVEWVDGRGKELGRRYGDPWGHNLSGLRWTRMALTDLEPPKGTEEAVFGVHLSDRNLGGRGAFVVDDVSVAAE